MFRSLKRWILPNPFDRMLQKTARKGGKKILLYWNRGLGDIALGLYAMVQRILEKIPKAEITFLTRKGLLEGFSLLGNVKAIGVDCKRGELITWEGQGFDLVIENPNPTEWVRWQLGKLVPRLKWDFSYETLWEKFGLEEDKIYIGVQLSAENGYASWRNWPEKRWRALFSLLATRENVRVLLFGFGDSPSFDAENVIDLRGKTSLFELLSLIKNRCFSLLLPDSGILSMVYYLDESFPIRVVSLWADPNHGILKQNVDSPNPELVHIPLIAARKDLKEISAEEALEALLPLKPLIHCDPASSCAPPVAAGVGCVILAGGQGSRLGFSGPKGLFSLRGKSLFERICKKAEGKNMPVAVMTSPLNHHETVAFFEQNSFFGLEVHFFQQQMRPLLDERRRPIELRPGEFLQGPNGNGSFFRSFVESGVANAFEKKGIDIVTVIPVDDPLADPFDAALIDYHRKQGAEVTVKCVKLRPDERSMGILAERGGKPEIVEYTEIVKKKLEGIFGNTGQAALNISFIKRAAQIELPLHWVQKRMHLGQVEFLVWKGELFIFDAYLYAKQFKALYFDRDLCYAPLKTRDGIDSVLLALDKR